MNVYYEKVALLVKSDSPIGIIDSGVGGLTVVKEVISALPQENIIYFGDSFNCPYGNKSESDILSYCFNMLKFMKQNNVKCVALACNTMSTLVEKVRPYFDFPIISFVECAAKDIISRNLSAVGLIATNFTANSGSYNRQINAGLPDCEVISVGSHDLTKLIDMGLTSGEEVEAEIKLCIDKILEKRNVKDIILGCTHYPIVTDSFKKLYPDINFINPAVAECRMLKKMLADNGALNENGGDFSLYSSGETDNYFKILKMLGSPAPKFSKTQIL